jgi:hypothetical protein
MAQRSEAVPWRRSSTLQFGGGRNTRQYFMKASPFALAISSNFFAEIDLLAALSDALTKRDRRLVAFKPLTPSRGAR